MEWSRSGLKVADPSHDGQAKDVKSERYSRGENATRAVEHQLFRPLITVLVHQRTAVAGEGVGHAIRLSASA